MQNRKREGEGLPLNGEIPPGWTIEDVLADLDATQEIIDDLGQALADVEERDDK